MDDLETLKVIKEKESSVEKDISEFEKDQKKLLSDFEDESREKIKEAEEKALNDYDEHLKRVSDKVKTDAEGIIEAGRKKASSMNLRVKDSDLEKIVLKLLDEYLKEE